MEKKVFYREVTREHFNNCITNESHFGEIKYGILPKEGRHWECCSYNVLVEEIRDARYRKINLMLLKLPKPHCKTFWKRYYLFT